MAPALTVAAILLVAWRSGRHCNPHDIRPGNNQQTGLSFGALPLRTSARGRLQHRRLGRPINGSGPRTGPRPEPAAACRTGAAFADWLAPTGRWNRHTPVCIGPTSKQSEETSPQLRNSAARHRLREVGRKSLDPWL